jgi:hypothetical protein
MTADYTPIALVNVIARSAARRNLDDQQSPIEIASPRSQ